MRKYAIIVAGGGGQAHWRCPPKQFRMLAGFPMLYWSMRAFREEDPSTALILVLHRDFITLWNELSLGIPESQRIPHQIVSGGETRTASVVNGLDLVDDGEQTLVAVHDAARPLVSPEMIARGWDALRDCRGAVPVVAVTDSLRKIDSEGNRAVDRSNYVAVQTPQVFHAKSLKQAYELNPGAVYSDDASALEASGLQVVLFEGSPRNMKVTNPGDLEIAELFINQDKD